MTHTDHSPITADLIRGLLQKNHRAHSIPLFDAIVQRASEDADYGRLLATWLEHGGTIRLRDDLARPFETADFILARKDRRYPWTDAWTAIDSARLEARLARDAAQLDQHAAP